MHHWVVCIVVELYNGTQNATSAEDDAYESGDFSGNNAHLNNEPDRDVSDSYEMELDATSNSPYQRRALVTDDVTDSVTDDVRSPDHEDYLDYSSDTDGYPSSSSSEETQVIYVVYNGSRSMATRRTFVYLSCDSSRVTVDDALFYYIHTPLSNDFVSSLTRTSLTSL